MNLAYQDEQHLIEQLQHNSEAAFDHIYDVYWKPLFKYAYNRLQAEELAKDMVQEVFISLWNKKDTLEPATSLSAYLFSILRFKLIDHYHASEVRKRHVLTVTYVALPTNNNTDQKVHLSEINSLLSLSIKNLPNKMKEIFELSRIQGHSTRQISEHLNISEQTVKNQLSTALKRLRLNFTDYLTIAILCYLLK